MGEVVEVLIPSKEQVRSARDAAGLTQAQAAEIVYVTSHAWHYWEKGKRAMPAGLWELFLIKTEVHHD